MATETHRTEAKVDDKGNLSLRAVPFRPGEVVEVILIGHDPKKNGHQEFKLRGKPVRFDDPTSPIASDDWDTSK